MKQTPLIICGALGRMGQEIVSLALKDERFAIKEGLIKPGSSAIKPADWNFSLGFAPSYSGPGVLIDFSHYSILKSNLEFALKNRLALLIGCTGHDQANKELISSASKEIPILVASNTSLLIELLRQFCSLASGLPLTQVSITDIHHEQKKDAPSGTALILKEALGSCPSSITSLRIGKIPGEHRLSFFRENEQLDLVHRVSERRVFAEGALFAAQFLFGRAPGLYSMKDVLSYKLAIENT